MFKINQESKPYLSIRDKFAAIFKKKESSKCDFWALKQISFDVQPGDTIGLIGKNGAGKSTLLKILSKITPPTSGSVIVRGRIASLLEVGTGFHPELTGRENIYLNGSILGMKRKEIDEKFEEIVEFSGVNKFLDSPLKFYSSGMQLRLAFAVASFLEPEILIIDEVLAVGDAAFQKKCIGKMEEVSSSGRTIIFVSHNMAAISQLCKKAIWLDNGEIRKAGSAYEVITEYLSSLSKNEFSRSWNLDEAPGDNYIRLLKCAVVQNEKETGLIDINLACQVTLDFSVLEEVHNLICGVSIYSLDGVCITANADWKSNNLSKGVYNRSMLINPQTFAEGDYTLLIQLVFFEPNIRSVYLPNILTIHCHDSDHDESIRGNYKEAWPGLMRLGFNWTQPIRMN